MVDVSENRQTLKFLDLQFPGLKMSSTPEANVTKSFGAVTVLTRCSERSMMDIIASMTGDAGLGRGDFCRRLLLVAGVAVERGMPSGQFKLRITRMIERPPIPAVRRMALSACLSHSSAVVLILMTTRTGAWSFAIGL